MKKSIIITLFLFALTLTPAFAQAPEGKAYTTQADDWLSKVAEKEYGEPLAYPVIVEATNAKAAEDNSFSAVTNPNVIEVGQKLWLPAEILGIAGQTATAAAEAGRLSQPGAGPTRKSGFGAEDDGRGWGRMSRNEHGLAISPGQTGLHRQAGT